MSTYVYLECQDHNPPLSSNYEVGQHLSDLPRIRRDIANRDVFVAAVKAELDPDYDYFTNNAASFLTRHPHCRIGIFDEYGEHHPVQV